MGIDAINSMDQKSYDEIILDKITHNGTRLWIHVYKSQCFIHNVITLGESSKPLFEMTELEKKVRRHIAYRAAKKKWIRKYEMRGKPRIEYKKYSYCGELSGESVRKAYETLEGYYENIRIRK